MQKINLPPKDPINSLYIIKIYFYIDEKRVDTKLQPIYSKFVGQNERKDSLWYWRERIHSYRLKSPFGFKNGDIYSNQNPDREKEPILRIFGNGKEIWDTTQAHYIRVTE